MESSLESQKKHSRKESENTPEVYKEIAAKLPKSNGWNPTTEVYVYQYEGFWYYEKFVEGLLAAQDHFKAQPSDIICCSNPKSGTTWLKALMFAIVTRSSDFSDSPLLSKVPHECVPLLEIDLPYSSSGRDPNFPLLATHVPYSSLPKSVIDSGCKMVYIWREPKDAFVSLYLFVEKSLRRMNMETVPMQRAFELFCDGISYCGPYWDHVQSYWRAHQENPGRILFLKYEDMKGNTEVYVKKLADFMGYPFSIEEEEKGMIQNIIKICSFENLSNLEVNQSGKHRKGTDMEMYNDVFFRRGKVGDWGNYLTTEMAARMDSISKQKLVNSGLSL